MCVCVCVSVAVAVGLSACVRACMHSVAVAVGLSACVRACMHMCVCVCVHVGAKAIRNKKSSGMYVHSTHLARMMARSRSMGLHSCCCFAPTTNPISSAP